MNNYSRSWFKRFVQLSQNEKLLIAEYRNRPFDRNIFYEAIGFFTYFNMIIQSDAESGFYYDVSGDRFKLLANELNISAKDLAKVLDWHFKYKLLDEEMFKKYNILTSFDIQVSYLDAVRKRTSMVLKLDYAYDSLREKFKSKCENEETDAENGKEGRTIHGETRQDKTNDNINKIGESNNVSNTPAQALTPSQIETFKKVFPDKCRFDSDLPKAGEVPANINIEALITKIQSVEYLQHNFSLKYCCLYYDKIMSGFYDKHASNTSVKKNATNYTERRDYSKIDLNSLFDDLEKVEL